MTAVRIFRPNSNHSVNHIIIAYSGVRHPEVPMLSKISLSKILDIVFKFERITPSFHIPV